MIQAADEKESDRRKREALLLLLLIGSAIHWSEPQIKKYSVVTPVDISRVRQLWKVNVPQQSTGMIDGNGWVPEDQTYGVLSAQTLKNVSLGFASSVANDLESKTEKVVSGDEPIDNWQVDIGRTIKASIVAQSAVAVGGIDKLTPRDTQAAADDIAYSLRKLNGFARQLELKDTSAGSKAIVLNRVRLYAAAANKTFEKQRRVSHRRAVDKHGLLIFTDEQNVLGIADHCMTDKYFIGCPEETLKGWVKIGTLTAPGERRCLMSCKCHLEYRKRP